MKITVDLRKEKTELNREQTEILLKILYGIKNWNLKLLTKKEKI